MKTTTYDVKKCIYDEMLLTARNVIVSVVIVVKISCILFHSVVMCNQTLSMYLMKPMSITVKSSFFEDAVNFVLENEGKDHAVNDPNDSGGLTKFGISQHFNPQVNVANLTLEGAMDIYRSKYWAAFPFDEIKSKTVAIKLFDCSVLFGLGNMKKFVNAILKLHSKQEKAYVSYPKELVQEINNISPDLLLALLENVVHKHIKHITAKKPTLRRFFKGWSLRVDRMPI